MLQFRIPNHENPAGCCSLYLVTISHSAGKHVTLIVLDVVLPSQIHGLDKSLIVQAGGTEEGFFTLKNIKGEPLLILFP